MKLIIFREKHSDRHFSYETKEDLDKIFFKIFKERVDGDYYYDNSLKEYFKELIKSKNYIKIRRIMSDRESYEYEGYYLSELEEWNE